MKIIDFHAHAFPDSLASRAIGALEAETDDVNACLDGTIGALLGSMDRANIETTIIANIATKPGQFTPILEWSRRIASDRIVPFPSLHPADPDPQARVAEIHEAGFKGIKLHPYYQGFVFDDEAMFPIYGEIARRGLILLSHTGFDIAFPRDRIADPVRVRRVLDAFPDLRLVCSHLGAWEDWDEAERHLIGTPVFIEISFSLNTLPPERGRELLLRHPKEKLLFGTDSPWEDQKSAVERVSTLGLSSELLESLLYRNAEKLLGNTAGSI
jgi:uncharacterized protein